MQTADNHARTVTAMTLAEKASLMSGANFWNTKSLDRLGVPAIMLTDGPHGLRKQAGAADHLGLNASIPATCFPTAATLANSWDPTLIGRVGQALGVEAAVEDVSVLLGPGMNIKRNPLAGRNFEYFSEDPLLTGTLAAALVRGIQAQGVAASVKHFAVNSQETHRMSIDEVVDERALHEIYLEAFRIAVTTGTPWTLMSSYNKINGTYANENVALLRDILRDRWGFDGLVVTDWGGNNDRVAGLVAGNALEMPSTSGVTDAEIVAAVRAGTLDEAVLDQRVTEVLALIDRTAGARTPSDGDATVDHDAHHELAVEAARRSAVLLRNVDRTLPLGPDAGRVAVIGEFAAIPRYQGAGSSLVNPTRVDDALGALRSSGLDVIGYEPGFTRRDKPSARRARRAAALAAQADTVVLFLGLDESAEAEGSDRTHMRLARNQLLLARTIVDLGTRVVVVLAGGAPVELPFADRVDAILHTYLPGQGGGQAVADLLTGRANPSGKLAETYPLTYDDVPSSADFGRTEATAEHRESIYVGYRYYDKVGLPVRYPFGHGLSYTTFAYDSLEADVTRARVRVTNTGDRPGTEVVQIYIEAPEAAAGQFRAVRELAGYQAVTLEPGQAADVEIDLAEHAYDVYDAAAGTWQRPGGAYTVLAASSSRDMRAWVEVVVGGPTSYAPDGLDTYVSGRVDRVGTAEFERLLGRPVPASRWPADAPLTRDDIVAQAAGRGGFAGLLHGGIVAAGNVLMALGRPHAANNTHFLLDLPFRSVSRMSGGRVDDAMLDGLLVMVNGRFWHGLRLVARARRARRRVERAQTLEPTTAPEKG